MSEPIMEEPNFAIDTLSVYANPRSNDISAANNVTGGDHGGGYIPED